MSNVPGAWETVVLVAAVYRVWRLLAFDTVTEQIRLNVLIDHDGEWRNRLKDFVECPWCFGFWIAVATWAAWLLWPHAVDVAAVPFAISTAVGLIPKNLDP